MSDPPRRGGLLRANLSVGLGTLLSRITGLIRVGVLGCSSVAWRRTLPALVSGPSTRLVAVASRDRAKALRFAEAFQCAATTYEELLARDDIDAVYNPLPNGLHGRWTRAALAAGKHVL